jgi:hypothetical protein
MENVTLTGSTAKVVSRGLDSDCAAGYCLGSCSHLMWVCTVCSSEGGWGSKRPLLQTMAADHSCVTPPQTVAAPVPNNLTVEELITEARNLIAHCATYNFGMRTADKLAHEVAGLLADALEAVTVRSAINITNSEMAWKAYEAVTPHLSEKGIRRVDQHIGFEAGWFSALSASAGKAEAPESGLDALARGWHALARDSDVATVEADKPKLDPKEVVK